MTIIEPNDALGYYFSGLTDGEGCFSVNFKDPTVVQTIRIKFILALRYDDLPILEQLRDTLGCGVIKIISRNPSIHPNSRPTARFYVNKFSDIIGKVIPFFEKYPLRAKKKKDYGYWKEICLIRQSGQAKSPEGFKRILSILSEWDNSKGPRRKNLPVPPV